MLTLVVVVVVAPVVHTLFLGDVPKKERKSRVECIEMTPLPSSFPPRTASCFRSSARVM